MKNGWKNKLYFGDNLDILRDKIPDDFVDLIYLDPPFQSEKTYNIIFRPEAGQFKGATAQIQTFEDTWKWGVEAERNYEGLISGTITKEKPNQRLIELMKAMMNYLEECPMMAYLSMMAPRLLEMKRVLKNTGSIYLHCDPTASHYLKLLMDAVFGKDNFRREIVWVMTGIAGYKGLVKNYVRGHDTILYYTKTDDYLFNKTYKPYSEKQLARFSSLDERGRRYKSITKERRLYLDEAKGIPITDVWSDIVGFHTIVNAPEKVGYPTQKPEALLERIIKTSSKEGQLVCDPFCGCGTTVAVAEKLGRKWIGIDITYLAIDVISNRLKRNGIKENNDFEIEGEPKDIYSANKLAQKDHFQFQIWCVTRLNATPSGTKTGDKGIDGIINFVDLSKPSKVGKGLIQVKGTENINPSMVRDLKGTMKSQNADFGILITLKKETQGMINEATKEGYFKFEGEKIPKIQFLTVEDLFKKPIPVELPKISMILPPYKRPIIEKEIENNQKNLL